MRDRTVILVLAAGASSRMRGQDKLMQMVGGVPLLRRMAAAALATGARVLVTLPPGPGPRLQALEGLAAEPVPVAEAALGMGHSLAAGARAAGRGVALMVVPADMAGIGTAEMDRLLDAAPAAPDRIWRGMAADGRPGHPVLFPARLVPALEALTGDEGARAVLAADPPLLVPLPGDAAVLDLDTPEDWVEFRARSAD